MLTRIFSSLFILFFLTLSSRADFSYPVLPASGADITAFVPSGWKLGEGNSVKGDLDGDGVDDLAAMIEHNEEVSQLRGCGSENYDDKSRPRILMVLSGRKNGGYNLAVQNNDMILRSNEGGVYGDPFVGLKIERGTLVVDFYGGSNWRWGKTYRLRFSDKSWRLIGQTELSLFSGDGRSLEHDYNLVTGKMKITRGNEQTPEKNTVVWKKLKAEKIDLRQVYCWKFPFVERLE